MKIKKFEEKDLKALVDFNSAVFNKRDKIEESIRFRFFENPFIDKEKSEILIAYDTNGKIIGQILVMPLRLTYKGRDYPTYFGMDYFVIPEARNTLAGVLLANRYKDLKYNFGVGLTDSSLLIMKAFNVNLIGYMTKYIKLNNILSPFRFLFPQQRVLQKQIRPPQMISGRVDGKFLRVFDAEEILSETGYWNKDFIEFTRCKEFINWRFFYYPDKYFVYKYFPDNVNGNSKPSYFVTRIINWKKVSCLLLLDYRFDPEVKDMFNTILRAAVKLSRELKMAATITMCSLPNFENTLKKNLFFMFGRKMEIVTNFPIISNEENKKANIIVTFADSDGDFYYGEDKW